MLCMRIDLHIHSAVSDGTDTPQALIEHAAAAGLDAVALTDHDTFDGLDAALAAGKRVGVEVLPGVEFSTQCAGRSVHLLGYGPDTADAALNAELARVRAGRDGRIPAMVARLTELGMPLSWEEVLAQAGGVSVGRPHVADAMIARGYAADRDEVFSRWLYDGGPAFVDRYATGLVEAIGLIHDAGGVAVIAHPWSRGTDEVLTEIVLAELAGAGLAGIEVDHPDHDDDQRARLRALARRSGLLVTGGSDHHGTGKTRNPLGACLTAADVYTQIKAGCATSTTSADASLVAPDLDDSGA